MTFVRWRASAEHDLDLIFARVAEHDARAAERLIERLRSAVTRLADHPLSAPERESFGDGARAVSAVGHLIVYLVTDRRVEVVRIVDARRDVAGALRRER